MPDEACWGTAKNCDIAARIVWQVREPLRPIMAIGILSEVGPQNGSEAM